MLRLIGYANLMKLQKSVCWGYLYQRFCWGGVNVHHVVPRLEYSSLASAFLDIPARSAKSAGRAQMRGSLPPGSWILCKHLPGLRQSRNGVLCRSYRRRMGDCLPKITATWLSLKFLARQSRYEKWSRPMYAT